MLKVLLIATTREKKLDEFKVILKGLKLKLVTLMDINFPKTEPKETGKTYSQNAVIKAKFYGQKSKLLTLADDSGLEVEALPGKLGVKSKRYLANGTDKQRVKKLLKEMETIPDKKRKAKFYSAVALFDPKTAKIKVTQGICQGKISHMAKGSFGFGYDPIFVVNKLNKHFSQLTLKEKSQVSHRAKALKKMTKFLKNS